MTLQLPDPTTIEPSRVGEFGDELVAWAATVDDVGMVDEVRTRWAAIAEYIRVHGVEGRCDAEAASRRLEVRVGQINVRPGQGSRTSARAQKLESSRAREFEAMAKAAHIVEAVIGRSTDEHPPYRRECLRAIDRDVRQRVDAAARAIDETRTVEDLEGDGWWLLAGDFRKRLTTIPDGTVDLIVTDPPYPTESNPLWSELARIAKRVLTSQGVLVALSGKITLPDVMGRLGEHLAYGWVYCQPLPGSSSRILARHIGQEWKPWLAYSNGSWPSGRVDWHPDMLAGVANRKAHYRWEQSEQPAGELIVTLCPEGGIVLDPFAGSGTYGLAALKAGRRFLGIEMDPDRFELAGRRVGSVAA